eukprot:scaffold178690_cov53-Attheya_sp.AAC.3
MATLSSDAFFTAIPPVMRRVTSTNQHLVLRKELKNSWNLDAINSNIEHDRLLGFEHFIKEIMKQGNDMSLLHAAIGIDEVIYKLFLVLQGEGVYVN